MLEHIRLLSIPMIFLAALGATGASADSDRDHDHDQALELYEHGDIRSLADVMRAVSDKVGGKVVDVALDRKGDRWTYRLTVITPSGERVVVAVDARSMAIGGSD